MVQSNFIGTDITGTIALSTTTYWGIDYEYGSYTIGGLTPTPGTGLGNVISGNKIGGIVISTASTAVGHGRRHRRQHHRHRCHGSTRCPTSMEASNSLGQHGHYRRHVGRRGEPDLGKQFFGTVRAMSIWPTVRTMWSRATSSAPTSPATPS